MKAETPKEESKKGVFGTVFSGVKKVVGTVGSAG
jgi:hypothetical protein